MCAFKGRVSCAVTASIVALLVGGATAGPAVAESLLADPFVQQGEKLVDSEASAHAELGNSAAISANGNTALVGSWAYNSFAGAAWVFVRSGSTWTQQAELVGKEASALAHQGFSVALSADGNTALIGGPEDEGASKTFPGAVWVFTRSGSTWTEQQKLVSAESSSDAGQGYAVALSADGNTALIGGEDDTGGTGAAWVFTRSGATWTQQGKKLVGAHPSGLVQEGWSVALSGEGNTALIGGPSAEIKSGEPALGAAWMFTRKGSTWEEQEKLTAGKGAGEKTAQGESVALSGDGNTALIGGPGYEKNIGAAWVYTLEGGKWVQQGEKLQGEDESTEAQEGHSVSLSQDGNTALIGGFHDDTSVGAAWAFSRSGSAWSEQQKLVGLGSAGGFPTEGSSVALSADGYTALVGGAGDDGGVGAAWVFARSSGEPEHKSEHEPESNTPNNNGSGGAGSTSSSGSPTTPITAATPGIASTAQAVEELLLGCSTRPLVLNDVLIRGGRVALQGSAPRAWSASR
jgi:hypothetical protein